LQRLYGNLEKIGWKNNLRAIPFLPAFFGRFPKLIDPCNVRNTLLRLLVDVETGKTVAGESPKAIKLVLP
jgi:hypothetical protein